MFLYRYDVFFCSGVLCDSNLVRDRFDNRSDLLTSDFKLPIYNALDLFNYDSNFIYGFSISLIAKNKREAYSLICDIIPYHLHISYRLRDRCSIS